MVVGAGVGLSIAGSEAFGNGGGSTGFMALVMGAGVSIRTGGRNGGATRGAALSFASGVGLSGLGLSWERAKTSRHCRPAAGAFTSPGSRLFQASGLGAGSGGLASGKIDSPGELSSADGSFNLMGGICCGPVLFGSPRVGSDHLAGNGGVVASLAGDVLSAEAPTGLPERELQPGTLDLGGSLTKVVELNWGCGSGLRAGTTCLAGRGGGGPSDGVEAAGGGVAAGSAGGVIRGIAWVAAGAGFATEESITTILPAPPFLLGSWVVGDFRRPVMPLEGNGGSAPLLGVGALLSAIILKGGATDHWFGMDGEVGHGVKQTFYRIQRGFALD